MCDQQHSNPYQTMKRRNVIQPAPGDLAALYSGMALRFWLCLAGVICCAQLALGQQLPLWSQFREFNYQYNPAAHDYFSVEENYNHLDIDLAYRLSWTSIQGAPRTALLGGQYFNDDLNMIFGGSLTHDQFGPTSFTGIQLQYAYRINFSDRKDHALAIGLSGILSFLRVNGADLEARNPDDVLFNSNVVNASTFNVGAGLYYSLEMGEGYNPVYLLAGIGLDQGLPSDLLVEGNGEQGNLKQEMHLNAQLALRFYYGYSIDYVEPVILYRRAQNAPPLYLAGFRATFLEQRLLMGAQISREFEPYLQFGFEAIPRLRLGYALSFFLANTFSSTAQPGTSHELALGYRIEY